MCLDPTKRLEDRPGSIIEMVESPIELIEAAGDLAEPLVHPLLECGEVLIDPKNILIDKLLILAAPR